MTAARHVPEDVRARYHAMLVRPEAGIEPAHVDETLERLARRGVRFDTVLAVLVRASYREDHSLTYTLPELKRDLDRAYELQCIAGGDDQPARMTATDIAACNHRRQEKLVGAALVEYKAAVNRAFHALSEMLSTYDVNDGGVCTLVGREPGDVRRMPLPENDPVGHGTFMAGVVCAHAMLLREDQDPFELVLDDGEGPPFKITIGGGEVKFDGEVRTPRAHRDPAEVSGYAGAIDRVRESAKRAEPLERLRIATEEALDVAAPGLRDRLQAIQTELPPPAPRIVAQRPLDAFGTQGHAARELQRLGVPHRLAGKLLGLASRSHAARPLYDVATTV